MAIADYQPITLGSHNASCGNRNTRSTASIYIATNGITPMYMWRVVTSGGATPRLKNNAQPNGGVRNGVCMVTQISMPSHTRSTFCAAKFGRNSGTTLEELSALGRHANSPVLKN